MASKAKKIQLRLITAIFTITIGLLMVELVLHLFNIPHTGHFKKTNDQFINIFNKKRTKFLYHLNNPNVPIKFWYSSNPRGYFGKENEVIHNANRAGFRGKDFTQKKNLNTTRFAFVGDSFTFCEGVKDEDTFPEQVKRSLRQAHPNKSFESYNLGVGGYNSEDYLRILKQYVVKSNVDTVFLDFNINDIEPRLFSLNLNATMPNGQRGVLLERYESGISIPQTPEGFIYKSRIVKTFWLKEQQKIVSRKTINYYNNLYDKNSKRWKITETCLKEFFNICKKNNINCKLLIFPLLHSLNNYPFTHIHKQVAEVAQTSNVQVIDMLDNFKNKNAADLWVHPADHHPNEIAQQIIADRIVKELSK